MNETSKSHDLRIQKDHYNKYLFGEGIDIGAGSDPLKIINGSVLPYDVQSGDANLLSNINDDMFDFVYASHCLEHILEPEKFINEYAKFYDMCSNNKFGTVEIPYISRSLGSGFWISKVAK